MEVNVCLYVADSRSAVAVYREAFEAELGYHVLNENGSYFHAELVRDGRTIVSLSESREWAVAGRNMQFCVNFGKENRDVLTRAYGVLAEGGEVLYPLGPCDWNELMADVVDRFGVRWYIAL